MSGAGYLSSGYADPTAADVTRRLLQAMPAATFELEGFTRLAQISITRRIPTAAVEAKYRPQLLINPDFIQTYCQRDEHLFLLVMHELLHVLLAHTSMYTMLTKAHNIAFDAIINARLSRHFHEPIYRGFFERLNAADQFPHLLLRPPEGWPDNPTYPTDVGPLGTERILRQLYPSSKITRQRLPFYSEILDLIKQDQRERGQNADGEPMLLGDHESGGYGEGDETFAEAVERMAEEWPMQTGKNAQAGQGTNGTREWQVDPQKSSYQARRVFANVLRRSVGPERGIQRRRERAPITDIIGNGVLPNARDRMMPARQQLGVHGVLWSQLNTYKARITHESVRAHVYLDVSGSMRGILPYLVHLLIPYVKQQRAAVFQFSTKVEPMSLPQLRQGNIQSTGGTSIQCVMHHLLNDAPRVKRAVLVTDGHIGRIAAAHQQQLAAKGIKIHAVLPAESPYDRYIRDFAATITILPPVADD
ncbi:MAG: VWA domain-containing protein [Anaerolineae bacterium]|nr:VWA domain-containing protein [Anaerolineae bacterium]